MRCVDFNLSNQGSNKNIIILLLLYKSSSVTRLCCNSVIFLVAYKTLPQFQGYKSKTYPGTFKERTQIIEPRRIVPPPNFGSDWKKIGSRRTKMITVQECSEPRRRILIVETNEKEESKIIY